MTRSSAVFVPYDLRPAKQIERRLIIDLLLAARSAGIDVSPLRYVGMGGVKFVDFLMVHKFLGNREFVSIERDRDVIDRCRFNKPYSNIQIYAGEVSEFVKELSADVPHIFWLDYDWSLSRDVFEDLIDLGSKLAAGSLITTVSGEASGPLRKLSDRERLSYFRETFNDFALEFREQDFSESSIRFSIAKLLLAIINYSFKARYPVQFTPILRLLYKDSFWMVTVGGYLGQRSEISALAKIVRESFTFLPKIADQSFFEIPQFNLTEGERRVLDLLATQRPRSRSKVRLIKTLGFSSEFLRNYQSMIRYIPRYFESAI